MEKKEEIFKNLLEEIVSIAESNKLEEKIQTALKLLEIIEKDRKTADVLYDERISLQNISDSLYNLRCQLKGIDNTLIEDIE
ncbi:hypothetical protein AAGG74_19180 [Bacillus mexicanus]|uniref:hypothetical protein n=1 Tax=Bacillus mexicanus TaxID=2834415 RepID=UPI003D1AAE27